MRARNLFYLCSCLFLFLPSCKENETTTTRDLRAAYVCKQDSDCLLSCKHLTTCCDQPCLCSRAYNRRFYKRSFQRLKRSFQKRRRCGTVPCPKVKCPTLTYRVTAQCYHGRCRAKIHHAGVKSFDWKKYHGHPHPRRRRPPKNHATPHRTRSPHRHNPSPRGHAPHPAGRRPSARGHSHTHDHR